jgi:hypothetical protein
MRIILALALLGVPVIVLAQTGSYQADLAGLRSILEKTASYRSQIQGEQLGAFNKLYNEMAADTPGIADHYKYFYNLSRLFFPLRDNHLAFYQLPDRNHFRDKESIEKYVATKEFAEYPRLNIDTDSLKTLLSKKPAESVEGIYHYHRFYSVGLFKSKENEYIGVVVDSEVNLWPKGHIAIHLYEFRPGFYKAIYGHPLTKAFTLQPIEKYINQSLVNSYFHESFSQKVYSKQLRAVDHVNLPQNVPLFQLKNINKNVQYLLIRSFQANSYVMKQSDIFYDSIKNSLSAAHLILDLRNHEGGAGKESNRYYKLLEKYTEKGKLYVLVNNETLSQSEILILQLKRLKNIVIVGQTTKGMLAYGSNYGRRQRLPGGQYEVYPTDMTGNANLLQYEDVGIRPDIFLDADSDWIDQLLTIINRSMARLLYN